MTKGLTHQDSCMHALLSLLMRHDCRCAVCKGPVHISTLPQPFVWPEQDIFAQLSLKS